MLELLLIVLLIMIIFGGVRWRSGAAPTDAVGIILLVVIVLIVVSLLTPFPYHYRLL